jgi:uncharacterized protein YndB with AHSA1/START domain
MRPRDLDWRTWTDKDVLARWYGPNVETVIHRLDLAPDGLWLVEMKWGDNARYERIENKEVDPPERLVWRSPWPMPTSMPRRTQ